MGTERITAFSDGVIAIIITIMVLELKVPHGTGWDALLNLWPVFLSYVLSFIYVAIYWNNHHHLFSVCGRVDAAVMWSNAHLLFWLSIIPVATGWMGESNFAKAPTAFFGMALLMPALAYTLLQRVIARTPGQSAELKAALRTDSKGFISLALYVGGIASAFVSPLFSCALYAAVAVLWMLPDRRIEREHKAVETTSA